MSKIFSITSSQPGPTRAPALLAAACLAMLATPADAQLSASIGFESTTGLYGKPTRTEETVMPVAVA